MRTIILSLLVLTFTALVGCDPTSTPAPTPTPTTLTLVPVTSAEAFDPDIACANAGGRSAAFGLHTPEDIGDVCSYAPIAEPEGTRYVCWVGGELYAGFVYTTDSDHNGNGTGEFIPYPPRTSTFTFSDTNKVKMFAVCEMP